MANKVAVRTLKYCLCLIIVAIICEVLYFSKTVWTSRHKDDQLHNPTYERQPQLELTDITDVTLETLNNYGYKKILFWNKFARWPGFNLGFGRKPFVDFCTTAVGFTEQRCETTMNRSELESSDAVVFHMHSFKFDDLPPTRRPEQVWVFYLTEAPVYTNVPKDKRSKLNGLFNWTMTHRRDSDVPDLYFHVRRKKDKDPTFNLTNIVTGERHLVAWLVSHCKTSSKREKYVEQLKKHIPIDVYGGCGNKCPGKSKNDCLDYVFKNYKFYLAFENSLCNDYVTEKFSNALERGAVPIVYGGADYSAMAPPNSFIDTNDFKSPQQLAEYIKLLNSNDALYRNYFRWRQDYELFATYKYCNLCEKLHTTDPSLASNHRVYDDLVSWWYTKGNCK